jgi:hypothetical protein
MSVHLRREAGSSSNEIHELLFYGAASFNRARTLWKYYVQGNNCLDPYKLSKIAIGEGINFQWGGSVFVQFPCMAFMIGARFSQLFKQQDLFHESLNHWYEIYNGTHPLPLIYSSVRNTKTRLGLSPHTICVLVNGSTHLTLRTWRICEATLNLGWRLFELIIAITDIFEMFHFRPHMLSSLAEQSVRDSGLNVTECLSAISQNKEGFLNRMEQTHTFMYRTMKRIGISTIEPDTFNEGAKYIVDWIESGNNFVQTFSFIGEPIKDLGKGIIQQLAPKWLSNTLEQYLGRPEDNYWLKNNFDTRPKITKFELNVKISPKQTKNVTQKTDEFLRMANATLYPIEQPQSNIKEIKSNPQADNPKKPGKNLVVCDLTVKKMIVPDSIPTVVN